MKKALIFCLTILLMEADVFSQVKFLTTAEKSDYTSTSDYKDVMNFIDQLLKTSSFIRVENIAVSTEGRKIPLLIIGNPLPESPAAITRDKRVVVYVQANIHAGEVEGKEATLMFARDLLKDKNPELLKNVILLICPVFNPDGNEKISPLNRTDQNGPDKGVGIRYNGQFLDLNRDAIKAESPEMRGVLTNVFNRWDPAIFMDCHTTNGSYHIEPVTFTWMVNPNGNNSLISYMRDKMMPEMSKALFNSFKVENCFYGEFIDMMDPEKGWELDASEPRYMSNYYGIRNRLGILNENYVYADFRSRVLGCYNLIHCLLDYASIHKAEIKKLLHNIDSMTITRGAGMSVSDSFAIEYLVRPITERVTVRTFEADLITNADGSVNYKKSERQKNVTVPYFIDFYPVKSVRIPFAYLINVSDPGITGLLKIHGIKIEKLSKDSKIKVERFEISELKGAPRLNQGHYTNTIKGIFLTDTIDFPAGTILVRTAQPLSNVAAYLLEPQSNDGLVTWNFLDRYLVPQWGTGYLPYPVYKIMDHMNLKTTPVL